MFIWASLDMAWCVWVCVARVLYRQTWIRVRHRHITSDGETQTGGLPVMWLSGHLVSFYIFPFFFFCFSTIFSDVRRKMARWGGEEEIIIIITKKPWSSYTVARSEDYVRLPEDARKRLRLNCRCRFAIDQCKLPVTFPIDPRPRIQHVHIMHTLYYYTRSYIIIHVWPGEVVAGWGGGKGDHLANDLDDPRCQCPERRGARAKDRNWWFSLRPCPVGSRSKVKRI